MTQSPEITICLGSSCFSRGNNQILQIVKDYLTENHLNGEVGFKGHLCADNCCKGPVITVNGIVYKEVNIYSVIDILNTHFSNNL